MSEPRLQRIWDSMRSPGWPDIVGILDGMIGTAQKDLLNIMTKKPETLTGKVAIAKANRANGLMDFKNELNDLVAPLAKRDGVSL